MEAFKDFRKAGIFHLTPERQVQGELILNGEESSLELFSRESISTRAVDGQDITGILRDGTKVSLINCIDHGSGSNSRGEELFYFASIFPHFAILGDEHVTSSSQSISKVSFLVSDAAAIFYDFDAFGSVNNAHHIVSDIATSKSTAGRSVSVGENPMVFYFSGKHQIASCQTVLGEISVAHNLSVKSPGPNGIHVDNKIFVTVTLPKPTTITASTNVVQTLLRFLEIIAGRPQSILRLIFDVSASEQKVKPLDVYWSMFPAPAKSSEKPHPADLPIRAALNPDVFEGVLKNGSRRTTRGTMRDSDSHRRMSSRIASRSTGWLAPPTCSTSFHLRPSLQQSTFQAMCSRQHK